MSRRRTRVALVEKWTSVEHFASVEHYFASVEHFQERRARNVSVLGAFQVPGSKVTKLIDETDDNGELNGDGPRPLEKKPVD